MDSKFVFQIKDDINLLSGLGESDLMEVLHLTWEFLFSGLNKVTCKSLASKLQQNYNVMEALLASIAFLLLEMAKNQISAEEFVKIGHALNLPEETSNIIHAFQCSHATELAKLSKSAELDAAGYKNLEWRLESQLGSRSLRGGFEPKVVLKIDLERQGKGESVALVSDIPNIIRFSQMVEQALQEGRTQNSRKVQRAVS